MRREVDVNFPAPADESLTEAVARCQDDADFLAAIARLYERVDAELARTGAICMGGGACCKFDLTGRLLYVSTGELALLNQVTPPRPARCLRRRCPWQVGPRCTARASRPLGCRTFFCKLFCNKEQKDFCNSLYERTHQEIRLLHQRHCLPYVYVELTAAVLQLTQKT